MRGKKTILKEKADTIFSKYIRKSKANFQGYVYCYTCGKQAQWEKEGMQCGHFVKRDKLNTRYDEANVRIQCMQCNVLKGGNYPVYAEKLIQEKGSRIISTLNKRGDKEIKATLEWYQSITDKYTKLFNKL